MPITIEQLLCLLLAGGAGTLARYFVHFAVNQWFGANFPYGIMTVNLAGCFLFGLVSELLAAEPQQATRFILLTGFMGAFTTFSTFTWDSFTMMRQGNYGTAILHIALQVLGGLVVVAAGFQLGRRLHPY